MQPFAPFDLPRETMGGEGLSVVGVVFSILDLGGLKTPGRHLIVPAQRQPEQPEFQAKLREPVPA